MIKTISRTSLCGIQAKGPSSFNDVEQSGAKFASDLWHQLIEKIIEADLPLDNLMYGVSWPADGLTPPQEVFYFCGFESESSIPGFDSLTLEGGNYFEYKSEVPATDLNQGFQEAYMVAMPASGFQGREGQHLELYGAEYDPESPIAKFTILIPVK
jgi:predicted transcriptional regulator YdeE